MEISEYHNGARSGFLRVQRGKRRVAGLFWKWNYMSSFCGVWFLSSGQWPQDVLDTQHVSKTGHISCIQRVQWHWSLTETKSLLGFKASKPGKKVVVGDGGFEDSTHNQSTQVWQKLKGNKNQFPKLTGHLKQNEGTFFISPRR